jgi:hypothetical protein
LSAAKARAMSLARSLSADCQSPTGIRSDDGLFVILNLLFARLCAANSALLQKTAKPEKMVALFTLISPGFAYSD